MATFVIILHCLTCLFLILVVLLQPGNKGGMGAAFGGGGGSTVFGGRGANTFLAKLTAGGAVVFMLTSFSLVYFSSKSGSVMDNMTPPPAKQEAPAEPAKEKPAKDEAKAPAEEAAKPAEAPAAAPAEAPAAPATEKPASE